MNLYERGDVTIPRRVEAIPFPRAANYGTASPHGDGAVAAAAGARHDSCGEDP